MVVNVSLQNTDSGRVQPSHQVLVSSVNNSANHTFVAIVAYQTHMICLLADLIIRTYGR